jgi:hypothetical protein
MATWMCPALTPLLPLGLPPSSNQAEPAAPRLLTTCLPYRRVPAAGGAVTVQLLGLDLAAALRGAALAVPASVTDLLLRRGFASPHAVAAKVLPPRDSVLPRTVIGAKKKLLA